MPTTEQRRDFVSYVASAHSWYKHLPAFLPGAPFYFYLNRSAGCDWVARQDGFHAIAERKERGFHYSAIPTAEYRARFGLLNYSCAEGTAVFLSSVPFRLPRDKMVAIPGQDARPYFLPEPILEAGRTELTAVIHPYFSEFPWRARPGLAGTGTPWWTQPFSKARRKIAPFHSGSLFRSGMETHAAHG